jgi:Ase1/PRC1/MAP65 family protein
VTTIKQMHISLHGKDAVDELDDELQVMYPLHPCLQRLKEKCKTVSKKHRETYEQVKSTSRVFVPGRF